jgi:hypothetical protein
MTIIWLPLVTILLFIVLHLIALLLWLLIANLIWVVALIPSIRKLILKHSANKIGNPSYSFEDKRNTTNNRSNRGWYAQYIHTCLIDFGYIVCRAWGWKRSCPFKPSQSSDNTSYHCSSENVTNTSKKLGVKKRPESFHSPDSSTGENDESTKTEPNHIIMI